MDPTETDFKNWEQALRPKLSAMMTLGHRPNELAVFIHGDREPRVCLASDLVAELRSRGEVTVAEKFERARESRPGIFGLYASGAGEALIYRIAEEIAHAD